MQRPVFRENTLSPEVHSSPRTISIDKKKISSGTQGTVKMEERKNYLRGFSDVECWSNWSRQVCVLRKSLNVIGYFPRQRINEFFPLSRPSTEE